MLEIVLFSMSSMIFGVVQMSLVSQLLNLDVINIGMVLMVMSCCNAMFVGFNIKVMFFLVEFLKMMLGLEESWVCWMLLNEVIFLLHLFNFIVILIRLKPITNICSLFA